MTFENLKKNRKKLTDELRNKLEDVSYIDDRIWKLSRDKSGTGWATIRFLPNKTDGIPYAKTFSHSFQGPTGQWYIENSITTLEKSDPVSEYNMKLWETGTSENQQLARDRKRKLYFFSNIYVINDPLVPNNNGKVFIFKYGKVLHDMLKDAMYPKFETDNPFNPFDMWEGADFNLKIKLVEKFFKYDKSAFSPLSEFLSSDAERKEVYSNLYDIREFDAESNFKTYKQLESRFNVVMGNDNKDIIRNVVDSQSTNKDIPYDVDTNEESSDENIDLFKKLAESSN